MASCALCAASAVLYCVNDDAVLCSPCDTKFHANPLAARHERRPLVAGKRARPAPSAASAPSSSADDVAVVPQCGSPSPLATGPFSVSGAACGTLFDDIFTSSTPGGAFIDDPAQDDFPAPDFLSGASFPKLDSAADLLCYRFDSAPQGGGLFGRADAPPAPLPAFNPFIKHEEAEDGAALLMVPQVESEMEQPQGGGAGLYVMDDDYEETAQEEEESDEDDRVYRRTYRRAQPSQGARLRRAAASAAAAVAAAEAEPELTREQRVQRYKEKRARRVFRKTVRYQSRKAYAEVRPRIKGRFVSPEEFAAYNAHRQQDAVVPGC